MTLTTSPDDRRQVLPRHARSLAWATLALLVACGGGPAPPPPGAAAPALPGLGGMPGDPIGFLLETRDSLHLPDSTVQALVRLNLRLFNRNATVQMSVDTMLRGARFDPTRAMRDSTAMPADLRERLRPLFALRREQTAAARDTAYAMLTPAQQDSARTLFDRMTARQRRRQQGPQTGRPPDRP
jgi:hypothetical protein